MITVKGRMLRFFAFFKINEIVLFLLFCLLSSGAAFAADKKLMVFGDSLVAGYGLTTQQGFTSQLQQALDQSGYKIKVINAGVSGDTTAGGRARLDWSLAENPDYVILVLGGNDMLRGLSPTQTRRNLLEILEQLTMKKIPVLFCGMLAPVNMGAEYQAEFNTIYPDLARQFGIGFYPFFLEGVALNPALNQPDGLHPNHEGVGIIVKNMMPAIKQLLDKR